MWLGAWAIVRWNNAYEHLPPSNNSGVAPHAHSSTGAQAGPHFVMTHMPADRDFKAIIVLLLLVNGDDGFDGFAVLLGLMQHAACTVTTPRHVPTTYWLYVWYNRSFVQTTLYAVFSSVFNVYLTDCNMSVTTLLLLVAGLLVTGKCISFN